MALSTAANVRMSIAQLNRTFTRLHLHGIGVRCAAEWKLKGNAATASDVNEKSRHTVTQHTHTHTHQLPAHKLEKANFIEFDLC